MLAPRPAAAQDAQQRAAAADAYDRGSAAFLAGDYATAARWFETAHRFAPAASALLQAVRSHQRNNDPLRAASLALMLANDFEGPAAEEARTLLDEAAPTFHRVVVTCEGCAITVDGSVYENDEFFVSPDEPHTIELGFATGDVEREVQGPAGEVTQIEGTAPRRSSKYFVWGNA